MAADQVHSCEDIGPNKAESASPLLLSHLFKLTNIYFINTTVNVALSFLVKMIHHLEIWEMSGYFNCQYQVSHNHGTV